VNCPRCDTPTETAESVCSVCGFGPAATTLKEPARAPKRVRSGLGTLGPVDAATRPSTARTPIGPAHVPPSEFPEALRDRFEVLRQLGTGGMGVVWLARDTRLGREVAVKLIRESTPDLERRFEREGRLLAGLEHPHIVRLYDYGTADGASYLIMEYVRGKPLSVRLAEGRPTTTEAVRIAVDILAGLEEAHRQGIVHRDIKPANVFLESTGSAKVADFGLARRSDDGDSIGSGQSHGLIVGTPGYMAPEQARAETAEPVADVYGAGVILHEMLTGQRLFTGSFALIGEMQSRGVAPPSSANPGVPAALDEVVTRALSVKPEARPGAAEMRASLSAWLDRTTRSGRALLTDAGVPAQPYKLLEHMGREDAPIFYGRDEEVAEVAELIESARVRVLFVFGPCGIGKSSLLRAGVLPALDPARYEPIVLTGGPDPAAALREAIVARALALSVANPGDQPLTPTLLELQPRLALDLMLLAQTPASRTPVLILDQLEEVFTQNPRGSPRIAALHELVALLVESQALRIKVMLSFRTEFRGELFPLEERLRRYQRSFGVREIGLNGLVEAIEGPSSLGAFGFTYEDGFAQWLADDILRSTQERGESMLPVMQIVCRQLYDGMRQRGEKIIGRQLYDSEVGGTSGALRRYVEERLGSPEYAEASGMARNILKQLTMKEEGGERFARVLDEEEALEFPDRERARIALERLVADHLVLREAGDEGRRRVRLASEVICSLVDAWALEPDDTERAARVLTRAHRQWQDMGRAHRDLLPAGPLALIQRQRPHLQQLSPAEQEYIDLSVRYHQRRRLTLTALVSLPLVAMFGALFVLISHSVAEQVLDGEQRRLESARRLVGEFIQRHYERLLGESTVIAESPKLIAAMDTGDPPTVLAEAERYRDIIHSSLFVLTDAKDAVLSSLGTRHERIASATEIPGLNGEKPATGVLVRPRALFLVVTVPLRTQGGVQGHLTTGFEVDRAFADLIKNVAGADVIIALEGRAAVHTLPVSDEAIAPIAASPPGELKPVWIGAEQYLPMPITLAQHGGHAGASIMLLRSLSTARAFVARVRTMLGFFDVSALTLTLLLYAFLLRRWYQ
jgi:predicted Ser/Thr protein kinase